VLEDSAKTSNGVSPDDLQQSRKKEPHSGCCLCQHERSRSPAFFSRLLSTKSAGDSSPMASGSVELKYLAQ
jgi:hypothetical protein